MSNAVFTALRTFFSGGGCPRPGCIGECAAAARIAELDHGEVWQAYCYVWNDDFHDSEAVAKVVMAAGGVEPNIAWTLYDGDNGDRKGRTEDGTRAWVVTWFEPTATGGAAS